MCLDNCKNSTITNIRGCFAGVVVDGGKNSLLRWSRAPYICRGDRIIEWGKDLKSVLDARP